VCFGDEERKAFSEAILEDFEVAQDKFAYIDVKKAKVGDPEDQRMILENVRDMPGGCTRCNTVVMDQLRLWIQDIVYEMALEGVGMDLKSGNFVARKEDISVEDLNTAHEVASLFYTHGKYDEAKAVYVEVIAGRTARLGADHVETLRAKMNLALLLQVQGDYTEAKALYAGREACIIAQNDSTRKACIHQTTTRKRFKRTSQPAQSSYTSAPYRWSSCARIQSRISASSRWAHAKQ
jgi:hypothetical protein